MHVSTTNIFLQLALFFPLCVTYPPASYFSLLITLAMNGRETPRWVSFFLPRCHNHCWELWIMWKSTLTLLFPIPFCLFKGSENAFAFFYSIFFPLPFPVPLVRNRLEVVPFSLLFSPFFCAGKKVSPHFRYFKRRKKFRNLNVRRILYYILLSLLLSLRLTKRGACKCKPTSKMGNNVSWCFISSRQPYQS